MRVFNMSASLFLAT